MLVLFETPAGHALFKVLDEGKLRDASGKLETLNGIQGAVKLQAFQRFQDTAAALSAATAMAEGKISKDLKKWLKKQVVDDKLAVGDGKLGAAIKEKTGLSCVFSPDVNNVMRGIRSNIEALLEGEEKENSRKAMVLGLAHSLSRYKLKFSPDKVDTMIVQAIALLDDLDKEINTYAMRLREWYGWHFPELGKIVTENLPFAKIVRKMGMRSDAAETDLSDCVPEEVEDEVKSMAQLSMGTEISDEDLENIRMLCEQVITLSEYRLTLSEYLRNRMIAIAPNLTAMVGELVGARLIAHAGSLLSLAKYPASTVQILGAEKALFRALKTKHATPKYGLIYHASVVGQANPKFKGRISRTLASKCSLAVRVDALGDTDQVTVGEEGRLAVEARLRRLEGKGDMIISKQSFYNNKQEKYTPSKSPGTIYNAANDMVMEDVKPKAKIEEVETEVNGNGKSAEDNEEGDTLKTPETGKKKKRKSKDGKEAKDEKSTEKKKKKRKRETSEGDTTTEETSAKKKKKKKRKSVDADAMES